MYRKLSIAILYSLLIALSAIFLIRPKQKISETEKRVLATFPAFSITSYLDGSYTRGINQYINDHFPWRAEAVLFTQNLRYHMGIRLKNREKIIVVKKKREEPKNQEEGLVTTAADSTFDFEAAYEGSLIVLNGRIYTLNTGNPAMSPKFAAMLNDYGSCLNGKTRVFSCVAPLSSAFIPVKGYESYSRRNKITLDAIADALNPGLYFCDIMREMKAHSDETLWYGSDHHWNARGAYYAYVTYCREAGLQPVSLSEMKYTVRKPFWGSLYELSKDKSVRDTPDTLEVFKPYVNTEAVRFGSENLKNPQKTYVFCNSRSYTTFLCGDAPLIRIRTDVKNGKRAAVVKNSMGNAFASYLISHYEEVWVFDFRYSKHNMMEVIERAEIDDLIFALGMYGAMTPGTINMMARLATHPFNREEYRQELTGKAEQNSEKSQIENGQDTAHQETQTEQEDIEESDSFHDHEQPKDSSQQEE